MEGTHYCCVCHLLVAPGDPHRHFNGFVAHVKPCLDKKALKFRKDVGELVVKLQGLDTSFGALVPRVQGIRTTREAEGIALDLRKRLSSLSHDSLKRRTIGEALEELKSLTQSHLFWEIPEPILARARNDSALKF